MSKTSKILCLVGSALLLVMAAFHGSGLSYVNKIMAASDADNFIKQIFPILFAHPSLHLVGLAAFGILSTFLAQEAWKVLMVLLIIVLADALLAFFLGGVLPGFLLVLAALCFGIAVVRKKLVRQR